MKKIFLLLSISFLLFTSCSGDSSTDEVAPVGTRLKKYNYYVLSSGGAYYLYSSLEYFYNGDKLDYTVNESGYDTHFYYTGDLITKKVYFTGATTHYTYDSNDRIILADYVSTTGSHSYSGFVYHTDGSVVVTNYYYDSSNVQQITQTRGYTYQNGNLTVVTGYNCTYDNQKSPFKNVLGYNKFIIADNFYITSNNMLTMAYPGPISGVYNAQYSYLYNSAGYPTNINIMYQGTSWPEKYEFFYE